MSFKTEKLISSKYKFVYLSVPKVATRSLLTALYRNPKHDYGVVEVKLTYSELFKEFPETKSYFKFSFVRNPFARVVSCYLNKICTQDDQVEKVILDRFKSLKRHMSFEAFVNFLCSEEGSDLHPDRHWISQSKLLLNENDEMECDKIGKLEDIDSELVQIAQTLKMPSVELPVLNTRKGWNVEKSKIEDTFFYRDFYSSGLREKIEKRYALDLETFQYTF